MNKIFTTRVIAPALSLKKVMSGSLLVAGTAVGAGMLGIPAVTAQAGFIPGTIASLLVWAFMLITGFLLLEVALVCPTGSNVLSIAKRYLGNPGRYVAGGLFLFLYYCLIVAYIAGGSPLIAGVVSRIGWNMPLWSQYFLFTGVTAGIIYAGMRWIDRINIVLSLLMIVCFLLLFNAGASEVRTATLFTQTQYSKMFLAVPILFGAFGYHNVIPSLCDYLQRDRKALRLSLVIGTLLAMGFYFLWQYLVLGSIDAPTLAYATQEGKTVISALQQVVANPSLFLWGQWFGALALFTSLLGVSISMVDFFADGCQLLSIRVPRIVLCFLTFLPPLLFTWANPQVFTKALGVAGGIGEAALNGLLPILLIGVSTYRGESSEKSSYGKMTLMFLFALGVGVMGIEIYDLMR